MTDQLTSQPTTWVQIVTNGKPGPCFIKKDSSRIDLGDGLWMYAETEVRYRDPDLAVTVKIGVEDGRLVADEVTITAAAGGPITSETLRAIPLAQLVSWGADGIQAGAEAAKPTHEEAAYVKRHGLDETTLGIVARIYRIAYLRGEGPTKAVETLLEIPRSTAGRWVADARARGLLSGARGPGKAGV